MNSGKSASTKCLWFLWIFQVFSLLISTSSNQSKNASYITV